MWNTVHGRPGWIPFVGHTIFSEHFMPILLLLAPIYSVCQSPVALIVFQLCAVGLAAVLLSAIGKTVHLEPIASAAIVGAFLLSRASFFATTSFFYPESLQPVFVFGCVLAWRLRRRLVYWICLVLLLSTKEDATIYVAAFAAIRFLIDSPRRDSVFTFAIAVVWLLFAVGVAIPHSRAIDGLPASNPFLHARYATPGGRHRGRRDRRSGFQYSIVFELFASAGCVWAAPARRPGMAVGDHARYIHQLGCRAIVDAIDVGRPLQLATTSVARGCVGIRICPDPGPGSADGPIVGRHASRGHSGDVTDVPNGQPIHDRPARRAGAAANARLSRKNRRGSAELSTASPTRQSSLGTWARPIE
jgi:hypothetical protein